MLPFGCKVRFSPHFYLLLFFLTLLLIRPWKFNVEGIFKDVMVIEVFKVDGTDATESNIIVIADCYTCY